MSETKKTRKERKKERDERKEREKEQEIYLDSVPRFVKRVAFCIVEYIGILLLTLALASYLKTGSFGDMFSFDTMGDMFKPGGLVFTSLVAYIPVLLIGNVAEYFGSGSWGKLLFSILKCLSIIVWIMLTIDAAVNGSALDSISSGIGVDYITMNLKGLCSLMAVILVITLIIPLGEFIGARKKRLEAVADRKTPKDRFEDLYS